VDLRARRAAENENLFRRVNERVEELSDGLDVLPAVCECADPACAERLLVARDDYERARADPTRFLVATGHVLNEFEVVVEELSGCLVVAKRGGAAEVARAGDPRSE